MADKNSTPPPAESQPASAVAPPVPDSTPAAPARKSWTRYLTPALALVAALIIGGVAGVLIGQSTASASNASSVRGGFGGAQGGAPGSGGFGAGGFGGGAGDARGGFTAGTIQSIDGSTITVKETNGTVVKVSTSGTTTVTKSSKSSVSDLTTGETITVTGQPDASGTVTATRIAEGTLGLGGFGGGRNAPTGAPTAAPAN